MTADERSSTQTGIPIELCSECGRRHPVTRSHCAECGIASLFAHTTHAPELSAEERIRHEAFFTAAPFNELVAELEDNK